MRHVLIKAMIVLLGLIAFQGAMADQIKVLRCGTLLEVT